MIIEITEYRGGKSVKIKCDVCSKEIWTRGRVLSRKRHFCSKECAYADPVRRSELSKRMMNEKNPSKRIPQTLERRKRMSEFVRLHNPMKGKTFKHTDEAKRKIGLRRGEKHHNFGVVNPWWKPWMTVENKKWSKSVKDRYGRKCAICFSKKKLHAHHIAPQSSHPELTFDIHNGISLCQKCHYSIHVTLKKFPQDYEKLIKQIKIQELEDAQNQLIQRHALITTAEHVGSIFEKRLLHEQIPLVCTSGAFDPLCVGELRSILTASLLKGENGLFVVIVNGDEFLQQKKGFSFMPINERLQLIAALKGVDYVVPWDDDTLTVIKAIEIIKPNIFAKGGNKSKHNVPEYDRCIELGCGVVFGMGGHDDMSSSSPLVAQMKGDKASSGLA